jgi:uncharacterized membrane protein YcaP (DUF421 family)
MTWWDFVDLFRFSVSPVELVVRGTVVYLFLFLVFRVVLRRDVGSIGIADVLFVVIVADASQNAMAGEYKTISDGIVLLLTLIGWNVAIDRLAFAFPRIGKLLEPRPLLLVRNGRIMEANLRSERMTRSELMGKLRERGIEKLAQVKRARMESDGEISVIRYDAADSDEPRRSLR